MDLSTGVGNDDGLDIEEHTMNIILNGEKITTTITYLNQLCDDKGFESDSVATAVNGLFVPRHLRFKTSLSEGDMIEILVPLQGG